MTDTRQIIIEDRFARTGDLIGSSSTSGHVWTTYGGAGGDPEARTDGDRLTWTPRAGTLSTTPTSVLNNPAPAHTPQTARVIFRVGGNPYIAGPLLRVGFVHSGQSTTGLRYEITQTHLNTYADFGNGWQTAGSQALPTPLAPNTDVYFDIRSDGDEGLTFHCNGDAGTQPGMLANTPGLSTFLTSMTGLEVTVPSRGDDAAVSGISRVVIAGTLLSFDPDDDDGVEEPGDDEVPGVGEEGYYLAPLTRPVVYDTDGETVVGGGHELQALYAVNRFQRTIEDAYGYPREGSAVPPVDRATADALFPPGHPMFRELTLGLNPTYYITSNPWSETHSWGWRRTEPGRITPGWRPVVYSFDATGPAVSGPYKGENVTGGIIGLGWTSYNDRGDDALTAVDIGYTLGTTDLHFGPEYGAGGSTGGYGPDMVHVFVLGADGSLRRETRDPVNGGIVKTVLLEPAGAIPAEGRISLQWAIPKKLIRPIYEAAPGGYTRLANGYVRPRLVVDGVGTYTWPLDEIKDFQHPSGSVYTLTADSPVWKFTLPYEWGVVTHAVDADQTTGSSLRWIKTRPVNYKPAAIEDPMPYRLLWRADHYRLGGAHTGALGKGYRVAGHGYA